MKVWGLILGTRVSSSPTDPPNSKEGCGKVAISLSIGCPRNHFRTNRFGNHSSKIDVRKLFYEPSEPSCVAPSGILVSALAFQLYEHGFDPRLGGICSFVTIYNEIEQVSSIKS
ncbi:hypothetical protein AVEN_87509-1 [Araneus ventricosus]|uniref:Uncharacterized protein n=1 Tax=Araneus ventricosus TaxID=182803 RepID=A0A4Y2J284_ARAVE|nr:hypothetical protein AVEN_87509-1 [Araneus ventricosus]